MITVKRVGRKDYMGYIWFAVYEDGEPVMKQGVHVKMHAFDEKHALDMYEELEYVMNAKEDGISATQARRAYHLKKMLRDS